jgi:hypothetical protein
MDLPTFLQIQEQAANAGGTQAQSHCQFSIGVRRFSKQRQEFLDVSF